jgi:adenylate kinase
MTNSPPKTPGRCDRCGGELYQRSDDREETVKERLNVFLAQTVPILDYYEKQGKLVRVNGNLEMEHPCHTERSEGSLRFCGRYAPL